MNASLPVVSRPPGFPEKNSGDVFPPIPKQSGIKPCVGGLGRCWTWLILLLLGARWVQADVPAPIARWTFEGNTRDSIGGMHGQLLGDAVIRDGRLVLSGNGHVRTAPLLTDLSAKTLVARVRVNPLDQGGGGVLTIETSTGQIFDSIVYGERQPRKWIAGSDLFRRTRDLEGAPVETRHDGFVHMAIVYALDGSIVVYRDGQPYGQGYQAGLQTYGALNARVLMGMRHTGGFNSFFRGEIEEAALYDQALLPEEVAELAGLAPVPEWNLLRNGGFENGSLSPWHISGLPDPGTNLPPLLGVPDWAAQGRTVFRPFGGPNGLRLTQTLTNEPGQQQVLRFAYTVQGAGPGTFGIEVDGEALAPETFPGPLPTGARPGVAPNWAYATRTFTARNDITELAFTFPENLNGRIHLDDVRLSAATQQEPEATVSLLTNRVTLLEGGGVVIGVRRSGRLDQRAFATLELESGTADVDGNGADIRFADGDGPRLGLAFRPWQSELTVTLAGVVDSGNEGPESATIRLLGTGNAIVVGEGATVTVSEPPSRGLSMEFNGVDQQVLIPHGPALNPFPFTASFWLRTTQTDFHAGILGKYVSGSGNGWTVFLSDGRIRAFHFRDWGSRLWEGDMPTNRLSEGFVADGMWHHVAFTIDQEAGRLYVDGGLKDTVAWTGIPGAATSEVPLSLGSATALFDGTGGAFLRGRIDEVRVWSRALTPEEVRASMLQALDENPAGLVAAYDFEQASGLTLTNRAPSGRQFDGTIRGTVLPRLVAFDDPGEAPAPMLSNGGFEGSTLAPWHLSNSTTPHPDQPAPWLNLAYSAQGVRSFRVPDRTVPQRLAQNLATEPGKEYRLSFAYGLRQAAQGALGVEIGGAPVDAVEVDGQDLVLLESAVGGSWRYATRRFTATSTTTELAFLVPTSLAGSLHLDDVQVVSGTDPVPEITVELLNPMASVE
jgi:hypothetical protein